MKEKSVWQMLFQKDPINYSDSLHRFRDTNDNISEILKFLFVRYK